MLSHQAALKLQQENRQLRRATEFTKFLQDVGMFLPAVRKPICFISYAWEDNKTQAGRDSNAIWHTRLLRIKQDLEFLGAQVFLDISDMHGNMPAQMQENIEKSNFIFLIGTPRLMVRLTEVPPTNAAFEWEQIKAKLQQSPHCLLPLLFEGDFGTAFPPEVPKDLLIRDMRDVEAHETIIARLGNPMGIIPNIFGLHELLPSHILMQRYRVCWEKLDASLRLIDAAESEQQKAELDPQLRIQSNEITLKEKLDSKPLDEYYLAQYRGHTARVKSMRISTDVEKKELIREAKIMGRLRHPNIALLYGVCLDAGNECLVMEHSPKGTLSNRLGIIPLPRILQHQIALEIVNALSCLHNHQNRILHKDLTSENILLDDQYHAKLTGFGFSDAQSKSIDKTTLKNASSIWVAPEVLAGGEYTEKADVYSYGIILWEIMTGKPPAAGIAYDNIPVNYANIIRICLSAQPQQRPSAQELIAQLNTCQAQANAAANTNFPIFTNYANNQNVTALVLFEKGLAEKKQNHFEQAYNYFLQAAQLNHASAKAHVGNHLLQGKGIPKDEVAAFGWLLDAAQNGQPRAMYNVAHMYETGQGTVQDMNTAKYWYSQATAQSIEPEVAQHARKKCAELSGQVFTNNLKI